MLDRRETLRALLVAGLAGSPLLTACGGRGASAGEDVSPGGLRLVSADVPRSAGDPAAIPAVVRSLAGFTHDLWDRVDDTTGNLVLSPYSVAVALAMTANGAVGPTQRQMLDVLDVGALASYNAGLDALSQEVEGLAGPVRLDDGTTDRISLDAANQLFGDRASQWGRPFLTVLAKEYGAGMRAVDFRHDAGAARVLVNRWTSDRTHGRIPTILPAGAVDALTRLVLVNALYFKAPWATRFDKNATTKAPFHLVDGSTVAVEMMSASPQSAVYLTGDHYVGGRLPYAGGRLAMTVAIADAGHESDVLAALVGGGLTAPGAPGLAVRLPRFTFRTPTDLKPLLIAMGMSRAFDEGAADFSAMSPTEQLHVSQVLHQAFIAVDESGTEAAAATAVGMSAMSGMVAQHTLVCDRPFVFVLHDTRHGTPLFVGRVADPS